MQTIINILKGKKTYFVGVILALYGAARVFGYLNFTPEQNEAVLILLGALFGMSLRAGITKIQ